MMDAGHEGLLERDWVREEGGYVNLFRDIFGAGYCEVVG